MAMIKIINDTDKAFSIETYDNVSQEVVQEIKAVIDRAKIQQTLFDPQVLVTPFGSSACQNCANNPKNGGSGIGHCTLGGVTWA